MNAPVRTASHPVPFLVFIALLIQLPYCLHAYPFRDVSEAAGFARPFGPRIKYGGPAAADLDGDGLTDLIFGHHDQRSLQLYFNNGDGTFTLSPFSHWRDTHALTPARLSPRIRSMHFVLSRGGMNGNRPNTPELFAVSPVRRVTDVSAASRLASLNHAVGRGRSAIFINLHSRHRPRLDCIFFNAMSVEDPDFLVVPHHRAFDVRPRAVFRPRSLPGALQFEDNSYGIATDIDNDGRMELVTFHNTSVWRITGTGPPVDISTDVFPARPLLFATVSIAELDFDNDGRWDLFISRSTTGELKWLNHRRRWVRNVLLRNVGGRYVDVTRRARIDTSGTLSRGVSVGDFNNDGHMDIVVSQYIGYPDLLYLNNGDGTFSRVENPEGIDRNISVVAGDAPTAVDYDLDGRLDLIVSEGEWFNKSAGGFYKLLRNANHDGNNFLLVRVKSSPPRKATSLYAVARVYTALGRFMMRRVGSPGTTVSNSYIETLHFGLGREDMVTNVTVTWLDGYVDFRETVAANSTMSFGV